MALSRSRSPLPRPPHCLRRPHSLLALAAFATLWTSCNDHPGQGVIDPELRSQFTIERVEYGRLVDVYGLRQGPDGTILDLFERDVVIGSDIDDQRPPGSTADDATIRYDFLGNDPDTLQARLLIPRLIDSDEFREAYDALDDQLREVEPMRTGQNGLGLPFPVVPRNAALRLRLSARPGVDESFFVERGADGLVSGLRNTVAVQLLRIVGNVEQPGAFAPIPARVIVKPRALVLDPVLLGNEGLQYQTANNAAGLPASADQIGANLRIALPLDGPLALPGLRPGRNEVLGFDSTTRQAVVRDFRSGNAADTSSFLARGFVRDPLPLRLLGDLPMYVERVVAAPANTLEVTVFKGGRVHEIDRGDVFRFRTRDGELLGSGDVVAEPADDTDAPATQHVRVRVRNVAGLLAHDPAAQPGYPSEPSAREAWLRANAPVASCLTEFTAGGESGRDDPRNFLSFSPEPLPLDGVTPAPNEFVSPFAEALVRFSKPVDLSTVRWADTFYFAMRDLTDAAAKEQFIAERPNGTGLPGLEPAAFSDAKYRTPFLVAARVLDEDGSQTALRLRPTVGFYLDQAMRQAPPTADFRYFLHLIADSTDGGIRDLAGNRLDLQGSTAARASSVVMPFTLDTRTNAGAPMFPDNRVVSIVRRFAGRDEDANPSWYRPEEVQPPGSTSRAAAFPLDDLFGAYVLVDGRLQARPTTRSRLIADNVNQAPVVQQPLRPQPANPLGWCPQTVFAALAQTEDQRASNSTTNVFNQGIQNPLNPFGCRLQTLWREVDLSLSRTDPFDFNLDIEGMYWAPFAAGAVSFDEFDRTSLWLSHSEFRPAPCVGDFSALPSLPDSGLRPQFARNVAWNQQPVGSGNLEQTTSPRVPAYSGAALTIDPSRAVNEPNGINRFLPMPAFQKPYFVFRDETVMEQGGNAGIGSDLTPVPSSSVPFAYAPYIVSPFLNGQGRRWIDVPGPNGTTASFVNSFWNDAPGFRLGAPNAADSFTGGLVGSIALPLLADFWTWCDSSELPVGDPYVALGTNGWQVSVTLQSSAQPNFRVLSAGRPAAAPQGGLCMDTSNTGWNSAVGGWGPNLNPSLPWVQTAAGDNTLYWVMLDVARRQSVMTSGFVDLFDPHRRPEGSSDPRLGPFYLQGGATTLPQDVLPRFAYEFDPPLNQLPAGTSLVPQFRAASAVDPAPWYWTAWISAPNALFPAPSPNDPGFPAQARQDLRPTAANFPLDPLKAGDAHIRKWDTRNGRNTWTHFYNKVVTRYVEDPNELMNPAFAEQYSVPADPFTPRHVRYVNWRFVVGNNVDVNPPVAPSIDTFALTYRFAPQ